MLAEHATRLAAMAALAVCTACSGGSSGSAPASADHSQPGLTTPATAATRPATAATRPATAATRPAGREFPSCPPGALTDPRGRWVSPATGENAFTVTLTMRAAKPCSVRGYPRVTLLDNRGSRVPFGVVRGRGQYISNRPPQWVDLQPGERVFTEVAKYRCDTAHYQRARTARLVVAGSRITMLVPVNVTMDYCGRGDPGSTVQVAALTGHLSGVFP